MTVRSGDFVVVNTYPEDKIPDGWNSDGLMNHLMGDVVEVKDVVDSGIHIYDDKYKATWYLLNNEYTPYHAPDFCSDEEFVDFLLQNGMVFTDSIW